MKMLRTGVAALCLVCAAPAFAEAGSETDSGSAAVQTNVRATAAIPAQLSAAQRESYRAVFADLRAQNWTGAIGRLDEMRDGPLHNVARAMLYTMPGSPRVELGPLLDLIDRAPELPQAPDLARLAVSRGATTLPNMPEVQRLAGLSGQPRRGRPRPIQGDSVADLLEPLISPLLIADQPFEAETLLNQQGADLSAEARTSFQQRIAWVYYLNNNDREARRLADEARRGVTEWALHAEWVAGLAAWRSQDCRAAAEHFSTVAARSTDIELVAAGHYWAARADTACGHPERVQSRLRNAARLDETFYGLIAQSALGMRQRSADLSAFSADDWRALGDLRNVRAAVALSEIGESGLASDLIRHQARIGNGRDHERLLHLAAHLNFTNTQMWLAHNGPRGVRTDAHDRYPAPSWRPSRGWRVDQALVFAHALQESNFRADAVSGAGARGLMQVVPGTARDLIRWGRTTGDSERLTDPSTNMEFGQTYLEYLRDQSSTGGLLPKVIASYNAGPAPIAAWNTRFDQSDPLLYIESIPYWETRGYVPIVLRNYWIYEQQSADRSSSRRALVQGLWPRFPGMSGASAVRIDRRRPQSVSAGGD